MRRVMVAAAVTVGVLAAGGYATADVLDVAPGVLTLDRPAASAATPGPAATTVDVLPTAEPEDPALDDTAEDAPAPTATGLRRAVLGAAGAHTAGLGVSVRDGVTGAELFGLRDHRARVPASSAKLLAAVAVADTLDLGARIPTTVVAEPGADDLVLVARGDMLLAPRTGDPDAVAGRAGLGDLADQVTDALGRDAGDDRDADDVTLRLDLSFAAGPRVPPTWNPHDVRDGFAGPVAMTGLATRQARAGHPAPAVPEAAVAAALVDRLRERGVEARLLPRSTWDEPAPARAEPLGTVESATYRELLDHAIEVSDNSLAENLVRQAAATAGEPTGGRTSTGDFVRSRLAADAIPTPGLVLHDASGLSPGQRVAPVTLSAVLARGVDGDSPPLGSVVTDLPVSGLDGTLAHRFTEPGTEDVLGVPRAKTGTLRAGSALAGTTVTADGRPLLFVVQTDGFPPTYDGTLRARVALDGIVAALTRCGCR